MDGHEEAPPAKSLGVEEVPEGFAMFHGSGGATAPYASPGASMQPEEQPAQADALEASDDELCG